MDASSPRVSVVIPNRNGLDEFEGRRFLEMIFPTLEEQSYRDFDVTLVDNGSSDGSVEYVRERWTEVRVLAMGANAGFAVASNRGIEGTAGEYVALLNNDLELSPNWLEVLVDELDRDPGVGFATGKVMRYGQRDVLEQVGLELYTCGMFHPIGIDEEDRGQYERRRELTMATAAAVLYRRDAVLRAGGFDEDYFTLCEDADLCLRMRLAGYRGVYRPEVEAYHVRGGYTGQQSEITRFHLARNSLLTLLKDMPAGLLLSSSLKILLYQTHMLRTAYGMGFLPTLLRAYRSFLRLLPGTLRKRRGVQRDRVLSVGEVRRLLRTEYPIPTRFGRLLGRPDVS